jgi:hypothetical protein
LLLYRTRSIIKDAGVLSTLAFVPSNTIVETGPAFYNPDFVMPSQSRLESRPKSNYFGTFFLSLFLRFALVWIPLCLIFVTVAFTIDRFASISYKLSVELFLFWASFIGLFLAGTLLLVVNIILSKLLVPIIPDAQERIELKLKSFNAINYGAHVVFNYHTFNYVLLPFFSGTFFIQLFIKIVNSGIYCIIH